MYGECKIVGKKRKSWLGQVIDAMPRKGEYVVVNTGPGIVKDLRKGGFLK